MLFKSPQPDSRDIQPKDGQAFATLLFATLSKGGLQNQTLAKELYKLQLAALERKDGSDIMELCSLITEQIMLELDAFAAMKLAGTIPIFTKLSNSVIAQAFGDTATVMLWRVPLKYSVSNVIGFIKGKSAIHIARVYAGKRRNFVGQHFWALVIGC
jgi:hypothetical protein